MAINPVGAARLITDAQISDFEEAIASDSGLVVEVTVVDRYAEALAALCASSPTGLTVAWLDGISYEAALRQNCGFASLQVERDIGRQATTGAAVTIIGGRQLSLVGSSSLQALAGRNFCRLGLDDYVSWLVPSLMMRASGIDPVSDLESVTDVANTSELVDSVIEGDCTAGAIYEADYEDLDTDVQDELRVLDTSPPLPYAILMYPVNMPLGERIRLDDALLAADDEVVLEPFLDQDGLRRVSETAFEDLEDFLDDTGLDFAQLGS